MNPFSFRKIAGLSALGLVLLGAAAVVQLPGPAETQALIIQGSDLAAVRSAVAAVGGEITHELDIIDAVGARLSAAQIEALRGHAQVKRVYADGTAQVAGTVYDTRYPTLVGAKQLHQMGINGCGVTGAVLDSGLWNKSWLIDNDVKGFRVRAQYDVARAHRQHLPARNLAGGKIPTGYQGRQRPRFARDQHHPEQRQDQQWCL
jgi:hypothetical protein